MFCKNCGTELRDEAMFCPNCGTATANNQPQNPPQQAFVQQAQPVKPEQITPTAPQDTTPAPAVQPENEAVKTQTVANSDENSTPVEATPYNDNSTQQPQQINYTQPVTQPAQSKKPMSKSLKTLLFVGVPAALVVVICVVLVVFNFSAIKGYALKAFGSEEAYLKHVETEAIKDYSESYGEYYNMISDTYSSNKTASKNSIHLDLGDKTKEVILDNTDVDMSWFEDAIMYLDTNMNEDGMDGRISFDINSEAILRFQYAIDDENECVYFSLPGLSDSTVKVDLPDDVPKTFSTEFAEAFVEALPNEKEFEKLTAKYAKIVFSNIDNVTEEKGMLNSSGVSQKCTVLTVEITEEMLYDIAYNVLVELQNDEEVKEIILDLQEVFSEYYSDEYNDFDNLYDEYIESIDNAIEELEDVDRSDFSSETMFTLVDYVDSNNIIGRELITSYDDKFFYGISKDGKDLGVEITYNDEFSFKGNGVIKGSGLSGDFYLSVDDENILRATVDDLVITSSNVKGNITITPSNDLQNELNDTFGELGSTFALSLDLDCNNSKADITATLLGDEDELVTAEFFSEKSSSKKIKFPTDDYIVNADDSDAIEQWADDINKNELISRLEKANFPDEIIDALEENLLY